MKKADEAPGHERLADLERRVRDAQQQIADNLSCEIAALNAHFTDSTRVHEAELLKTFASLQSRELQLRLEEVRERHLQGSYRILGTIKQFPLNDLAVVEQRPPLRGLVHVADVLPIPTRKAIKAMAGDYVDEVRRLHAEGRPGMAKWNVVLAWGCAAWYVLRSPFDWIVSLLLKNLRGSSQ